MSKIQSRAVGAGILDKVLSLHQSAVKEDVRAYVDLKDEELIKLVQSGDDDAYAHIISRFQGKLYAYVMRLTNHREEAKEITQDVFMKAYRNLHTFDTSRKFSSWIYRIAHNESVNWLKKKTKIKMESLENHMENGRQISNEQDIHEELVKKQEREITRKAIDALPAKYRQVMDMRYLKQMSYDEIGSKLNKPINTIGTLINRAKKKLRQSEILNNP